MFSYPGKTFPPHNYQIELSPQEAPVIVQHGWQEFNSDNIQSIPKEEILNALYENSRNWHMVVVSLSSNCESLMCKFDYYRCCVHHLSKKAAF